MGQKTKALHRAFPYTLPVLTGYIFLGMAFGILMTSKGFHPGWTILMSVFIYAGSMQFVAIGLLTAAFNPWYALVITLIVNARHLFYGVSMLEKFKNTGYIKPYLIFGLTDETFSILCSTDPPTGINRNWFMLMITLLNHSYWIVGSTLGAVLGTLISFNVRGIDFVMTALFVVIFINQWQAARHHFPAIAGVVISGLCLAFWGPEQFIIPAMFLIIICLTIFRKPIERTAGK